MIKLLLLSILTYNTDIEAGQTTDNYDHDNIGNLIKDEQAEIDTIKWTVYGKVKEVIRTPASTAPDLRFFYDAEQLPR